MTPAGATAGQAMPVGRVDPGRPGLRPGKFLWERSNGFSRMIPLTNVSNIQLINNVNVAYFQQWM